MYLLVTSAAAANGDAFGALLAFELDGRLRGNFVDDVRIADPRGLAVDPKEDLLFLNSGANRVLAISSNGRSVRDGVRGLESRRWQFRSGWPEFRWLAQHAHNHRFVGQSSCCHGACVAGLGRTFPFRICLRS
jgi:hypothetical protein